MECKQGVIYLMFMEFSLVTIANTLDAKLTNSQNTQHYYKNKKESVTYLINMEIFTATGTSRDVVSVCDHVNWPSLIGAGRALPADLK